jgi:hypothetical protein
VYLLGAERLAPATGRCHVDDLLADFGARKEPGPLFGRIRFGRL